MIQPITTNSLRLMERSLDFLWTKQAAHMDNITNAETPGYKVKTVTFEERIGRLLSAAAGSSVRPRANVRRVLEQTPWAVFEDTETTRMDDNGVNALEQSLEAVRTAYQMQYTMQAISSDLSTLRSAITG